MTNAILLSAVLATGLFMADVAQAQATRPAGFELADLKWKRRVVIALATAADDASLAGQRRSLTGRANELAERDVSVIYAAGDDADLDGKPLPAGTAARLRQTLSVHGPFAVLLVGKDGGVKLRESKPVTADTLFGLIDTMPMRRAEKAGQ